MDRRSFVKSGLTTGAALALGSVQSLYPAQAGYDLVAVKGGEPDEMFDKAIESLGGMKQFVKKGQTVLVKPNIGWDVPPERAGNTNPLLVKRIIQHCFNSGAKEVFVFDNTCDKCSKTYKTSGIEQSAKEAGATVVYANNEGSYKPVKISGAKVLTDAKVYDILFKSDVFLNVPVLKNHSGSRLTIAMKNLMGIVWDRRFWHRNDLHQCIADFCLWRKPNLNIVDAYRVMKQNGPRGVSVDDVLLMRSLLISTDIVAVDAAAAKLYGMNPDDINYIKIADSMKIGRKDLENLKINRIKM